MGRRDLYPIADRLGRPFLVRRSSLARHSDYPDRPFWSHPDRVRLRKGGAWSFRRMEAFGLTTSGLVFRHGFNHVECSVGIVVRNDEGDFREV